MASAVVAIASPTLIEPRQSRPHRIIYVLRAVSIVYLALLVVWPVALVYANAFTDGVQPVLDTLADPVVVNAFRLTLIAAAWAVALNTVFGVTISLVLVRYRFPGRRLLNALVDLPLSVSPVVVGLGIVMVYNTRTGWLREPVAALDVDVLFAMPAIVLATTFVSMPLVIREVVPVLREIGVEQEQAARSLGAGALATFRRITLPAIKWGVTYGVVLCLARALGEFGAVKIVSGNLIGQSQTATLMVEQYYADFDQARSFTIAAVLATASVVVIILVSIVRYRAERLVNESPKGRK